MRGFIPLKSSLHKTSSPYEYYSRTSLTGFTLIETIIYVALFGILMVGVIAAVNPIFAGVERMGQKVMVENEITLVSRTITSLIPQINPAFAISPSAGAASTNSITFTTYSQGGPTITYNFKYEGGAIVSTVTGAAPFPIINPLTTTRVRFDNMHVKRVAAQGGTPGYIEISYSIAGASTTPMRTYLNF
ncbi:MAG: hypothetical protein RLZZ234_776 [Candidatus Parcubacteria bacterium]|jgi:type II secretory pathway pseudopilin PulG